MATGIGFFFNSYIIVLHEFLILLNELTLKGPFYILHVIDCLPLYGYWYSVVIPFVWICVKAPYKNPPLQPKVNPLFEQSIICCTDNGTNIFLYL